MAYINRLITLGKCLDRYYRMMSIPANHPFQWQRLNFIIDLDASKVNAQALLEAEDEDFKHDMIGIFQNIERNVNEPSKSTLKMFVPRVGFEK